jgi:hypothetical protein
MNKRQRWIERICDVEREYKAARSAMLLLAERLRADPAQAGAEEWSARDAENSSENLEATYLIRLFAEFESGLRDLWKNYFRKKRRTPMKHLLQLIATQAIPQNCVDDADQVRVFRNALVHEETEEPVVPLSLGKAKSHLCRYFSFFPKDW